MSYAYSFEMRNGDKPVSGSGKLQCVKSRAASVIMGRMAKAKYLLHIECGEIIKREEIPYEREK